VGGRCRGKPATVKGKKPATVKVTGEVGHGGWGEPGKLKKKKPGDSQGVKKKKTATQGKNRRRQC